MLIIIVLGIVGSALFLINSSPEMAKGNVVEGSEHNTIKIGWIGALTGPAVNYGVPARNAAILALEDVNQKGVGGKRLELIFEDGQANSRIAATAGNKLINQDKLKIIFTHSSPESSPVAPIAEENKVILFASATSIPDFTYAGDYAFRTTPVNKEGHKVAEVLNAMSIRKAVVFVQQTAYTIPVKDGFLSVFDGEVVGLKEFNDEERDFRTMLLGLEDTEAIVIFALSFESAIQIVKDAKQLGINGMIFGNGVFETPEIVEALGNYAEGIVFATLGIDEKDPEVVEFVKRYEERYGKGIPAFPHTMDAAAKIYIIAEALEVCGEDNECIKSFLYSIKDKKTLSGKLTIDENGDAEKEFVLKVIKGENAVGYSIE